jgi:hypothetical protein
MTHELITPTGKKLILVTGLPEDAKEFELKYSSRWVLLCDNQPKTLPITSNKLQIIGKLSDLSDFDEYVESEDIGMFATSNRFKNYGSTSFPDDCPFIKSKDSFLSLLRSKGFVLEEPEKPRIVKNAPMDAPMDIPEQNEYDYKYRIYQQQLSKYINPNRTLIIEINS